MITERVFHWAEETPDRTALIYNGTALSYRVFAQSIARARGFFSRRGYAGTGHVVMAVGSLLDFWVFSLALRSLGLTTIAVATAPELRRIRLPNVRCVVTTRRESWSGLEDICTELGLPLVSVTLADQPADWLDSAAAALPQGGHILQTSGTTGDYKMVLMTPAFDAAMLPRNVSDIGIDENSVLCVFDFQPWTGVGYRWPASPWTIGGVTVIEQSRDRSLAFSRPGITHAVLVTGMLPGILATPGGAFPRNDAMHLAVSGGTMTRTQVEQVRARITHRLSNWLASTEVGGIALTPLEHPEDRRWHRPLPGRVVEVVDDSGRSVPIGAIGRLRISTDGGPTSYLYDEAATEAFFKDGFFYPGDLALVRSDGWFALQGRVTDIINVRGSKISPAPVEERLCEALGVTGVCLFSMQDDSGEEGLHVVIETPEPIGRQRLLAAIGKESLGFQAIRIYLTAALPRNHMGKIMRQAVRAEAIGSVGQN